MAEIAEDHISRWRDGEERNVSQDMMSLTLDIAVRTLFGTTLPGEAEQVGRAMTFLMRYSLRRQRFPVRVPETWPTPNNRRANQELAFMDSLVYRMISERQAANGTAHHNDLLALLMDAMDEDGSHMTKQQLRDEAMTLFIAGHETTSQMLSWTWYALSQNPAIEAKLHEELRGVLGGRPPEAADLQRLPYLQAVMNESLRLYPPAYILARMAIEPCQIGGYDIPLGSTILLAPWVTHRDPRFFDDPDAYRPERWLDGLMQTPARGRVFSVWRWAAPLHRPGIRADGSGHRDRHARAEIPLAARAGARSGARAARHAAAAQRHSHDAARAELSVPPGLRKQSQTPSSERIRRGRHWPTGYRSAQSGFGQRPADGYRRGKRPQDWAPDRRDSTLPRTSNACAATWPESGVRPCVTSRPYWSA